MMLAVYNGTWYVVDEITKDYMVLRGMEIDERFDTISGDIVQTYLTNGMKHRLDFDKTKTCQHCGEIDSLIEATFANGSKVLVCSNCDKVTYK